MNESACISDLSLYELDRYQWLIEHNGSMDGFTTTHGRLLQTQLADVEEIRAHQVIPGPVRALVLSNENRLTLGRLLNEHEDTADLVTEHDVTVALSFVGRLFGVVLDEVTVLRAPSHVMKPTALGAVYSNGTRRHLVVVPEQSFDPIGVLVRQCAIAAHYQLRRGKPGIAAMMSDDLTQAMVGQFAMLRFAAQHPEKCQVIRHLQMLVAGEIAKGLSQTPEMPLGFLASDLGEQLMRAHGTGMFKAIVTDLYESATNGMAIWFGSTNFNGTALALALDDEVGMTKFMSLDAGDRTLADKLDEAFGCGREEDAFVWLQDAFNLRLATLAQGSVVTVGA
ncbi:hypothetical protein NPS53_09745 [Pseudomonas putida]|uniref:hypothetical protein n=1 Tax=Pseudomonas putida TaxID=303 RepID=UPI002363EBAD|nr:hypothetical protein [Pseudomonas putida]MDD2139861.1 hypothetical protein [Pseudomonas putida]HDS1721784.1 hypothetical protein [Pseudomonas putida]